jgi:hypothetical protein
MLAELYLARLEVQKQRLAQTAKPAPERNPRFVPVKLPHA